MKFSNKRYKDLLARAISVNSRKQILDLLYEVAKFNKAAEPTGIIHIDHVVGNQPEGEMNSVCNFYEKVFGWHRFWSADDKDVSTKYSALRSIVMANDNEQIKMPINEPAKGLKKSQIQEFIEFYDGPGIQHIAMSTRNIIETVYNLIKAYKTILKPYQAFTHTLYKPYKKL